MEDVKIVSASEKFDLLAPTYDDVPEAYHEQWDGPAFMELLGDVAGRYVLDVGCGTGRLMKRLEGLGADTLGVDVSMEMVERTRNKSLLAVQASIDEFTWNEQFDIVLSVLTLNYVEDKARAFYNIRFLLRRGGLFLMSSDLEEKDPVVRRGEDLVSVEYFPLSKSGYVRLLEEEGFRIEKTLDLFPFGRDRNSGTQRLPVGFMIASRKTEKLLEEEWRT